MTDTRNCEKIVELQKVRKQNLTAIDCVKNAFVKLELLLTDF